MKVDLSSTKDFTPPQEGEYPAEIVACDAGTTSTNFPKIDVRWRIEDGGVEKSVFQTVALGGEGAFRAEQLFIAIGMADSKEEVQGLEFETADLIGMQAILKIKHRLWSEEAGGDGSIRGNITSMKRVTTATARKGGLFAGR
jgi:hypothetical protein